jgi:hypothetical protein
VHVRLHAGECVHALAAWPCAESDDTLLLVGTSLGLAPGVPPQSCDLGRLLIMRLDLHSRAPADDEDDAEECDERDARRAAGAKLAGSGEWVMLAEARMPGAVLALAGGAGGLLAASAGAAVHCLQLSPGPGAPAALASLERVASARLRHPVTGLAWGGAGTATLVACDAGDGAHLLRLRGDALEVAASERVARAACGVALAPDSLCAGAIDRAGGFFAFAAAPPAAAADEGDAAAHAARVRVLARFTLAGVPTAIRAAGASFVIGTLAGGVCVVAPLRCDAFELLCRAEECAAAHALTAPLLGGHHATSRGGPPAQRRVLDGDLLTQLLHLPEAAQREILAPMCGGADDGSCERLLETLAAATALV